VTPREDNKAGKLTGETRRGNTPGEHSRKMKKNNIRRIVSHRIFWFPGKGFPRRLVEKMRLKTEKNHSVPGCFSNQVWDSAAKISMARERNQEIKGAFERMWDSFPGK